MVDTKTNEEKIQELGWLEGEDAICKFPEEVVAVPVGFVSPGLPITFFAKATDAQIQQAIDKGWIKFIDGDGKRHTFAEYVALFPDYPDPVFVLTLQGRWPPQPKKFYKIGRV